jgi:23S rRNA (uracil1939-C5)-methyltransferase
MFVVIKEVFLVFYYRVSGVKYISAIARFPDYLTTVAHILKMNIEKVTIKKVVNGGFGLSHLPSGRIVLVQRALPAEIVTVTVEQAKKNYLFGKIKRILKPHDARRQPPCKYYNHCGGCNLQHCSTATQITIKKEILLDLLQRSPEAGVREAVNLLLDPVVSPSAFGYRQRIRLQIDEQGMIGFRRFRSHEIVSIDRCLLAEEPVNESLGKLRALNDFHKLSALATEIELLLNPGSEKIVCRFHFIRKPRPADITAAKSICNALPSVESIFFSGEDFPLMGPYGRKDKSSERYLLVCYPEIGKKPTSLRLQWEVGGFCQVNLQQNRTLINIVLDFCKVTKEETVLDLFCGMGNFSIPLARQAKKVTGIEGQGSSIRSAKSNAVNNGLTNTMFIKSPIHTGCKKLRKQGARFDCIIIDPPRQGAPALATDLAVLAKKRLVYISCDPATLCRDLAELARAGFDIKTIQPIDMFPQTHHIETVVLLEKSL